jgi:hypothetical protein
MAVREYVCEKPIIPGPVSQCLLGRKCQPDPADYRRSAARAAYSAARARPIITGGRGRITDTLNYLRSAILDRQLAVKEPPPKCTTLK